METSSRAEGGLLMQEHSHRLLLLATGVLCAMAFCGSDAGAAGSAANAFSPGRCERHLLLGRERAFCPTAPVVPQQMRLWRRRR
jgi:hypothetical protein